MDCLLKKGINKLWKIINKLLSKIFVRRKFRDSQKPRKFCIFEELNFADHLFEQIPWEFNFAVEWNFRFSILFKNNVIKRKVRNGENEC